MAGRCRRRLTHSDLMMPLRVAAGILRRLSSIFCSDHLLPLRLTARSLQRLIFILWTQNPSNGPLTHPWCSPTPDMYKCNDMQPKYINDKSGTKVLEVHASSEVAGIKVSKESDVPEVLEDKNAPEVPKVMTNEVKAAESELLKVSEVTTSEDLETEAPKVFLRH
ncbi:hypothetical protein F2Q69_00004821 [Brassica cretica]|uniref:Uncharacterized protein n=1 Tax=Brassica cretica TaxID=69181 RepID=A0A8S9PFI9_BRACR|nr:hypothetical protein F2Q69_00004821 [Brassica cretica]